MKVTMNEYRENRREEYGDRINRTRSPLHHYDHDAESIKVEQESILTSDAEITAYSDQDQGDISPPRGRSHSRRVYVHYPSWDSGYQARRRYSVPAHFDYEDWTRGQQRRGRYASRRRSESRQGCLSRSESRPGRSRSSSREILHDHETLINFELVRSRRRRVASAHSVSRVSSESSEHDYLDYDLKWDRSRSRHSYQYRQDSQRFLDERWADTWREAVVFDDHDELYRPVEWDCKLEILEAQTIANSGHIRFPRLINSLSISESQNSLKWTREVLQCVIKNCEELQRARYCGDSINIIVGDQQRHNVACLVGIKFAEIVHFISWFEHFYREHEERRDASLNHLKGCLHECSSFLERLGLDFYPFHDRYDRHDLRRGGEYEIISSRNALLSKIFYSTRAIAMVLDLGVISFSGAHLRPFDQALFEDRAESYLIPCDTKQASIVLRQWRLGCLEGFCLENPVWVFSVHGSKTSSRTPLSRINETWYLSATPEEFASIWGPMWKYASKRHPDAILWYLVSPGFLIPGHWSVGCPEILEGEVLCHWTNDPAELNEDESFPSRQRYPRLLIGADMFKLSKNIGCRLDPTSFSSKMDDENRLRILGTSCTRWVWSDKITAQLSASASLGPASFGLSLSRDFQRKKGMTAKENLRVKMATEPGKHLPFLWKSLGVEISACTGNARRLTLIELLGTNTISKYLKHDTGLHWGPGDFDKWLDALAPKSVKEFCKRYAEASRRNGGRLARHFDDALKLAFSALSYTGLHGSSIDAFWEYKGDPLTIEISKWDQKWAGMLSDDEIKCALVVVSETCLQCTAANLLCRVRHPRPFSEELSVFETRLVLNYLGKVPPALASFQRYHRWTPEMIKALKPGDKFEMRPSGVLRVIRPLDDGKGIFVEWVHSVLPSWSSNKRRYNNLIRFVQGRGKADNRHHEYIEPFESGPASIPVFVVSNYREFASWAPWRLKGRK